MTENITGMLPWKCSACPAGQFRSDEASSNNECDLCVYSEESINEGDALVCDERGTKGGTCDIISGECNCEGFYGGDLW